MGKKEVRRLMRSCSPPSPDLSWVGQTELGDGTTTHTDFLGLSPKKERTSRTVSQTGEGGPLGLQVKAPSVGGAVVSATHPRIID
jgi:hypothetical protein